jgi:glucans biosynthesis protein C
MTSVTTALEPPADPVPSVTTAGERLHALDSLRAVAMLLGIVLHAGISLTVLPIAWPIRDVSHSDGIMLMLGFIHGFRMQIFMLLAGFFGHLVWQRLGTQGFLRQRRERIGLPFLFGMIVIIPMLMFTWKWAESRTGSTFIADQEKHMTLMMYPTAHLWFLEMLLILYLIAMALAPLARRPSMERALPRIDAAFDWLIRNPIKPLLLAVPTAALLWMGPQVPEIDFAGQRLLPGLQAVGYYGLFFGVGWWMHRRIHLLDAIRQWLVPYFIVALAAFVVVGGSLHALESNRAAANVTTLKAIALLAAALFSWTMTFAVTGLFLRVANGHRPWVRYLADASYWWYLWHLPIIFIVQVWIADWPLNAWLKLLLILAVNAAILLPSYHAMVRYTWVGRILNGPRERP